MPKGVGVMGSVKNLNVMKEASGSEMGLGVFEFTDDYSVFDYGKMPETIPHKGEALCRMAANNFVELEKQGAKSHSRKLVSGNKMEVNLVRVLYPQKGELNADDVNYLVPLEVIFRNSLPEGSSVFKRFESGQLRPADLGLKNIPKPGEKLKNPILDVSTKLEPIDRYMDWKEAQALARLSALQLRGLKEKTLAINDFITKHAEKIGLEHADGKVEFGIDAKGKLILVDVCGTLDENRLLYNGFPISKQVLRDYYKTTSWYKELEEATKQTTNKQDWPAPHKMPKELKEIISNMYTSVCEAWTNEKRWNSPRISDVIAGYKKFLKK